MSAGRERLGRLGLVTLALAVAWLAGELGVRLLLGLGLVHSDADAVFPPVPHAAAFRRSGNRALGWDLDPADPQVNSAGFRDRERPLDAGGAVRIAVLGDSVAFGRGVPAAAAFPALLERLLDREPLAGAPPSEVLNFAVGGYNTKQEVELYATRGRRYHPQLVILAFALNDAMKPKDTLWRGRRGRGREPLRPPGDGARAPAGPGTPLRAGLLALPRSELLALLCERLPRLWETAQERRHPWLGLTFTNPENWSIVSGGFARLAAIAREDGTELLVVILPLLTDFEAYEFRWIHAQVRAEAGRHGLPVLDLLGMWRGRDAAALRLLPEDTVHLNAEGHRAVAEAILAYLRSHGALARLREAAASRPPATDARAPAARAPSTSPPGS